MMKHTLAVLAIAMIPTCLYAVDGQVLINQATVIAAGGFPYTITQPGSYKLSGNLVAPFDVDGIDINSDNVTLDLNGFSIKGPVVCSNPVLSRPVCTGVVFGLGITSLTNGDNITVKNGAVRGFVEGLHFAGGATLVTDVIASGNVREGFLLTGLGAVIARCTAHGNGGTGIAVAYATISDSVSSYNGFNGFNITRSALFHSQATGNYAFGIESSDVSIYGSNAVVFNVGGDVSGDSSQGNNRCTSGLC